jgi:hypothetical protein
MPRGGARGQRRTLEVALGGREEDEGGEAREPRRKAPERVAAEIQLRQRPSEEQPSRQVSIPRPDPCAPRAARQRRAPRAGPRLPEASAAQPPDLLAPRS